MALCFFPLQTSTVKITLVNVDRVIVDNHPVRDKVLQVWEDYFRTPVVLVVQDEMGDCFCGDPELVHFSSELPEDSISWIRLNLN